MKKSETWIETTVGDIAERIVGGGTPSRKNPEFFLGDIPWATVKDISDNDFFKHNTIEHITEKAIAESASNLIGKGNVIIATRMGVGRGFINHREMAINQDLKALYFKKDIVLPEFFLHWYKNASHHFISKSGGSTVQGITLDDLRGCEIHLPGLDEQRYIADAIGTLDNILNNNRTLINKLTDLKKALMQELFTKGIGHKEFKNSHLGKIPKSWGVTTIGDISLRIVGGGTPSRKIPEYFNGNIPWATVKDLSDGTFVKSATIECISYDGLNNSASNLIEPGNVIIATRMSIGSGFINSIPMAINQDMKAIYLKTENISPAYFLLWFLYSANIFKKMSGGSTVQGITLDDLKSVYLPLPNLVEQRSIESCLLNIDNRVNNLEEYLKRLHNLKSALSQDLLSGKVRVKIPNPKPSGKSK